jgi:hypothetical protein
MAPRTFTEHNIPKCNNPEKFFGIFWGTALLLDEWLYWHPILT